MKGPHLRLAHLYPREMSIYGDRGNIISLCHRAALRGITVEVVEVGRGDASLDGADLIFFGGGQDLDQDLVARDLSDRKRGAVAEAIAGGAAMLAVCGGYQMLGSHYTAVDGREIPGLGLLDLHTVAGDVRSIGNVIIEVDDLALTPNTVVGFENHAGRTFLGPGLRPLGRCIVGGGNNNRDGGEGVHHGTVIGTYLHGSLLPKNPQLTDHLLAVALRHTDAGGELAAAPMTVEMAAHDAVELRVRREGRSGKS
ncbi:MAG: type 1 glutamine amidotransferase [Candidatus Dormibacteria bacterium]